MKLQLLNVETHQIGRSKGAGEAEEDDCAITFIARAATKDTDELGHVGCQQRCGTLLSRPVRACDAALDRPRVTSLSGRAAPAQPCARPSAMRSRRTVEAFFPLSARKAS